jgi:hypothetical protein
MPLATKLTADHTRHYWCVTTLSLGTLLLLLICLRAQLHRAPPNMYTRVQVEMGGGMTSAYHRRVTMHGDDISADALTQLGSGANCLGYYIYKGGTNPDGVLSTMEECQDTGYPNDLQVRCMEARGGKGISILFMPARLHRRRVVPSSAQVKSYDYFAPIAEFGNVHPHYHALRRLHLFVESWGAPLAPLPPAFPSLRPSSDTDTTVLKWAVRSDGRTGFVFVNNFLRDEMVRSLSVALPLLLRPPPTYFDTSLQNPVSNVSKQGTLSDVNLTVVLSDGSSLHFPATEPNMTVAGENVSFCWQ